MIMSRNWTETLYRSIVSVIGALNADTIRTSPLTERLKGNTT